MLTGMELLALLLLLVLSAVVLARDPLAAAALLAILILPLWAAASIATYTAEYSEVEIQHHAKLCWLHTTTHVEMVQKDGLYTVKLTLSLQPPDPCHRILSVESISTDGEILVRIVGASPPPGTLCAQVLPEPVIHTETFTLETEPHITLLFTDNTTGQRCSQTILNP